MQPKRTSLLSLAVVVGITIVCHTGSTLRAQVIASSITQFSGIQGSNRWFNGYRNFTLSGETEDYDPTNHFIAYTGGTGRGAWNGTNQQWTGTQWDLNTASGGPWTFQAAQNIQPNGTNSAPNQEHWAIRRWVATNLGAESMVDIGWHVRKTSTNGNGVTAGIWINGKKIEAIAVDGFDNVGVTTTNTVSLKPTDIVDLVITPVGPDGGMALT